MRLGAWAVAGWPTWLCWLLLLHTVSAQGQLSAVGLQENFVFTHALYNGTLLENAVGKVYVGTPVKMGISLAEIASFNVEFSIVEGDSGGLFHAESIAVEDFCFLRVRTSTSAYGRLNREHRERYYLRIRARSNVLPEPKLEAFTDLNITVLDQNEFSPLFPPSPFRVSIPEDTAVNSIIAQVRASDAEVGINGQIYYSLVDLTPTFAIHPTTGQVTLLRPLEPGQRKYKLRIRAEDRGVKPASRRPSPLSSTILTIDVTPVNRHAPLVQVHTFPSILEDSNPGSMFAILTVTDDDLDANGHIASVDVVNNTAFRVQSTASPKVFNVIVASRLDRESEPRDLSVTVRAVDGGEPAKTTTAVIPVRIQDINDNAPAFEKSLYKAEVPEVAPALTPVLFVTATDADDGQNGEVRYSLKDDEASKRFSIDEVTGLISTAGALDADEESQIILVVYGEDRASGGTRLTGQTKVIISVEDYNDNAPQFIRDNLDDVSVKENMQEGTSVLTVKATDADSNDNGRVSYSIQNVEKVPFVIDSFSGEIKTTEVFDFETSRKQYSLTIRASDWGSPYKHWTQQRVVIKVKDANDNSPEFEKTRCKGYLSREAALGTEVTILAAIDFDAGNIISYSISAGNEDGCFAIEPSTGSIRVACDLTAYSADTRTFTVVASDGEHLSVPTTVTLQMVNNKRSQLSATADVSVTCQETDVARRLQRQLTLSADNNENVLPQQSGDSETSISVGQHAPRFDPGLPDHVTVPEDTPVGSAVFKLLANDRDQGYPGTVLYVISEGNEGGAFTVDTFTGNLKVFSRLDHETKPEYNLSITAQDMADPRKTSVKVMQVFVSDANDNAPIFQQDVYEESVPEDVQVNTTVLRVEAQDADSGANARVQYTLLTHTEDFTVEPDSGDVKVKSLLDRESREVYTLLVQARDSGAHRRLSSTATVNITLRDVNDNFPQFVPRTQTIRVREDLPVGTVVTTLTAHDADSGNNGRVSYTVVDGADGKFQVDPVTGVVRIRQQLDYEACQVYNVSVRAEDGGDPPLMSMCLLTVNVVDVNENHHHPEFPSWLEKGSVAENSPVGTYVMTVRAHDADDAGSSKGRITYSIHEGTGLGRFSIDANGTIRTRQVLDRETSSHFWLTVYAQDLGLTPLYGRVEVLVTVTDVNDNIPQSLEPAYYAAVAENSRRPQNVVQVVARDGDLGDPPQELRFRISGGNSKRLFKIHPLTGQISTSGRTLDREKQEEHALEVTISDNGDPPLSSSTRVVVKVMDVNDQRPSFKDHVGRIVLLATSKPQDSDIFIYRTVAYDADEGPNAEVTYTLRSAAKSQFYVSRKTGEIFSRKEMKAGDVFDITVRATDNGTERRRSQQKIRLTVVPRPSATEHAPQFSERGLRERITESDSPGLFITQLSAQDPDHDSLFFAIEGGNDDGAFSIQPNSGIVLLARPVDWEHRSSYNLTVTVTDGVLKDLTWMYVEVLDINDNAPVFSHQLYRANVSESCRVGDHVLRVMATDADHNDRLLYSIASAASVSSLSKFTVSPTTGVVKVAQTLDREEMQRHLLTLMVRDQGVPSKKSFARVEIEVEDHNDHAPQFLSPTFQGRLLDTAAVGTVVLQVIARDQDTGVNAELTYSILSGNADSTFSMEERQGSVVLAKELPQSSVQHVFQLVVMAVDHGSPPHSATAQVTITITTSNNAPPVFSHDQYVMEIKENSAAGSVLGAVWADSQSTVVYTITAGNHNTAFFLNPNSGVLSTTGVMDYEDTTSFNLTVRATNIVGASAFATLLVHVSDENDNAPQFSAPVFYGNVTEAVEIGSVVLDQQGKPLVVRASDADSGRNALLRFSIVEKEAEKYFSVDANTGAIRTAGSLDHETTSLFNFTVQVQDQGDPRQLAPSPARVVIMVEDINDCPPRFSTHTYQAQLLLPAYAGVALITLNASDPDTVGDLPLTYSIVKGNNADGGGDGDDAGIFSLHPHSGLLSVEHPTAITQPSYELTVQASDGLHETQAQVRLTVEDSQDSGISFPQDKYTIHVPENSPQVLNLLVLQPRASGSSGSSVQHFTFSLLTHQDLFSVGATSGVLQTSGLPLDREQRQNYTVVVEVRSAEEEGEGQGGGRRAQVGVVVVVDDVNDNAPLFLRQPFHSLVTADAQAGDLVTKILATDADTGGNGELRYYLPSGLKDNTKDAFAINQYTGEVVVKRLTQQDTNTLFTLTVEAVDRGNPPQSSTVDVPIRVVDSSAPMFETRLLEVDIPEDLPVHSPVKNVQAISPSGHKLIYSITAGDRYGDFAVDFNTGLVWVASPLDRESEGQYQLVVRATDVRTAAFADMHLTINLQDVNDNKPVFGKLRYTQSVSEAQRVGASLLQVSAHDADQGANGLIHYSLTTLPADHHSDFPFFINADTGVVLLRSSLDRERAAAYTLIAVATDSGHPAHSSTASIHILVEDINDNPPTFPQPSFHCHIADTAHRGQLVTKVTAFDPDLSNAGQLTYSIVEGNDRQTFTVHPDTGEITVTQHRPPDLGPAYVLNVSVSDGVYTNFARVTVTVRNTNRHTPRFSPDTLRVELWEMRPVGTTVVTLTASDADRGNYGMLTYGLTGQLMHDLFSIDADTGEIRTRQVLDREEREEYELMVSATDNGGNMGFASVTVVLQDENDSMPQFLRDSYMGTILFNASIGTTVLQVKAVDMDAGDNSVLTYSLLAGDDPEVSQLFALDPDTGHITVTASLMFAANKAFQFFVGAKDGGEPPLENHVPVEISILGADSDLPPTFPDQHRSFIIQEDEGVGSVIATLRAKSSLPVTYAIVPGMTNSSNKAPAFSINKLGQIRVVRALDREITPTYSLTLEARTRGSPPLVGTMEVSVELQDINDHAPYFLSDPYMATVLENANVSTPVIQVRAEDRDLPRPLTYSFGQGMEEMASVFSVHPTTGWVSLLSRLDRETRSRYDLVVQVVDSDDEARISGERVQFTSSTTVIVSVMDCNDNAPQFTKDHYSTAVNEGALPGTVVLALTASDKDEGVNADLTYYIVDGDSLGQFHVRSSGQLFVNKALDRESRSRYQLKLAVTDGALVSYTEVMVTVLDDNDNAPVCLEPYVDVMENEDVAVGKPLAHIRASDSDEASTPNARIHYTLHGNGAGNFMLEKDSGVLRTAKPLDREVQQEFLLIARATDGGGLSCVTEVRVFLRDINDNPPTFTTNFSLPLTVQEDAHVNTLLTRITTSDRDTGINRNTRYRLEDHSSLFSIHPDSGILSLIGSLDREEQSHYSITIIAYNEISPEMSASAVLQVVVLDVNDNPPVFERSSYQAAVSETAALHSEVLRVRASSLDIGDNAAIAYSIAAGNQQGKFALDPTTGVLRVAEPLDHEVSREYFLTILARDHGSPPLTNTAVVSINISDVNDNPPVFSQQSYTATVNELAQPGTEVFKVLATDADSYANSVLTYRIIDGDPNAQFIIGPQDGVVQTSALLDREQVGAYSLVVQARDSGNPSLSSTAVVNVLLQDANDNAPVFDHNNYTAKVQEGRRTGIEILTLEVSDADTGDNGSPFTFDIIAGNDDGEFHVNSEGVLSTAGKLSKQVKDEYHLTVRAYDNGSPPLHSDTQVTVHVVDDSIYPPQLGPLSIHISSCMDTFPGGVIGQLEATDPDPYDTLSFSIVSPNRHLFDVHRDDGRLIALTGLDEGDYVVNVSVTDDKYTRFAAVPVTVVCVSEDLLSSAVTVQFSNLLPEQFYGSHRKEFQQFLKGRLGVRLSDVRIINVQPSSQATGGSSSSSNSKRLPRSVADHPHNNNNDNHHLLDVLVAVVKAPNGYLSQHELYQAVQGLVPEMTVTLGLTVTAVFKDLCSPSTCAAGQCVGAVVFDNTNLRPVVVNGESFVSAQHLYTHTCVCLTGEDCGPLQCGSKLCRPYEVCDADLYGQPSCHCPEGQTGPNCHTVIAPCVGVQCAIGKSMTFSGESFAKWTLSHPTQKRMSLSLRFRTRQSSAILMYAKGQVDYSILAVEEGSLVYRFNCGSGEGQVWVPVDLSDGQWHQVALERTGRMAEILLDHSYTAMGMAPGIHEMLNLQAEEIFFGAKVDVLRNGYRDISKGFEGCMDEIRMFNIPLPMEGSNSIAHSGHFEQVTFQCPDSTPRKDQSASMPLIPTSVCSSSPCLNKGVCQVTGPSTFTCVCGSRYKGARCELDTDPCQDTPCLNGGQCQIDQEAPNTFMCHCPSNLLGMRCTYGPNCRPNPCLQGGTCIEGPTSPLCHCSPGFAGLYCDKTINPCDSAPCLNGGVCQGSSGGKFVCNCTLSYTGTFCENINLSHITSTPSGISAEEIYGIIGIIAGILLLVLVFVAWRLCKRRSRVRRHSHMMRSSNEAVLDGLMKDSSFDLKRKVSNPDLSVPVRNIPSQPPPVPNRPASYTPSTHDSLNVLNNLDTVRNYGSAADDLEASGVRRHHIPDFPEYLAALNAAPGGSRCRPPNNSSSNAPGLPPLPSSNPSSDSESVHKAPWEFDYPNILGSYDDDKHGDNLAKHMPGLHSPIQNCGPWPTVAAEAVSVSSLPVSDSEDDLNGYHWDTSDWAPRPSLPNINEGRVGIVEGLTTPPSLSTPPSPPSYDGNEHIPMLAAATACAVDSLTHDIHTLPADHDYMTDSEYVGETENELDFEDRDDDEDGHHPPDYADLPRYDQLLAERDLNDSYELPPSLAINPDIYLPHYDQDSLGGGEGEGDGGVTEEEASNVSDELNTRADLALAHRVAERTVRHQLPGRVFLSPGYTTSGEYTAELEPLSHMSYIDDMSMSVGGYTSNASCSDISGLCEIEDSEINASENDDDDNDEHTPCLPSHMHTQV